MPDQSKGVVCTMGHWTDESRHWKFLKQAASSSSLITHTRIKLKWVCWAEFQQGETGQIEQ